MTTWIKQKKRIRHTLAGYQYSRSYKETFQSAKISDNEFICYVRGDGIFKFNSTKNEWKELESSTTGLNININNHISRRSILMTSGADMNNDIVLCKAEILNDGHIYIFIRRGGSSNLQTFHSRIDPNIGLLRNNDIYFIQSKSHQLCVTNNDKSCIYDSNEDEFIVFNNDDFKNGKAFEVLNISSHWNMCAGITYWASSSIRYYESEVTTLKGYGSCCTDDGKFVFLLGGRDWYQSMDNIIIYDNENKRKFKSNLKIPKSGCCEGIILKEKGKTKLLIAGFVNKYSRKLNKIIPKCVYDLIVGWFTFEYLHWIHENGDHRKIIIDRVL